jgi:dihydrolipoamide dehydrogenase
VHTLTISRRLGRAIANGRDEGVTKLLFDDRYEEGSDGHAGRGHGKILGGGMVGTQAGDMIGEIALAIEMGADAVDIGKTIHPHPTLGESIGMAAEIAHGSCTDVPPVRKLNFRSVQLAQGAGQRNA